MKNKHKGVSLIEVLFVLGILAVLLGGTMMLLSQANNKLKTGQTEAELLGIIKIVQSLKDSDSISASDIAKSGTFPQKFIKNDTIVSAFGTEIEITAGGGSYDIEVQGLNKSSCVLMATQEFGDVVPNLVINGETHAMKSGVISPSQATTMCSSSVNSFGVSSD